MKTEILGHVTSLVRVIFSKNTPLAVNDWRNKVPWMPLYLAFSIALEAFDMYLKYREYKQLSKKNMPKKMQRFLTNEQFLKANSYSKDKLLFSMITSAFDSITTWASTYWFVGPMIWRFCTSFFVVKNEYLESLLFLGAHYLISTVVGTPFALYHDFVIEARHGFNTKTMFVYFKDLAISTVLSVVLGSPIVCAFIWIVKNTGSNLYIWLWLFSVILSMVLMAIYPNFIAPLFNKFENLKDLNLREKIEELARGLNFPLKALYQMDGSSRSNHSNAYFYGIGKIKRIVLYDTLLDLEHSKILSILCHEMGHWRLNHTKKNLMLHFVTSYILCYIYGFLSNCDALYDSFGYIDTRAAVISIIIFSSVYMPVDFLIQICMTVLSRSFEYQADKFSFDQGYGDELREALITLHKQNKSDCDPDPLYSWFNYSHPTLMERLNAIEDLSLKKNKKD